MGSSDEEDDEITTGTDSSQISKLGLHFTRCEEWLQRNRFVDDNKETLRLRCKHMLQNLRDSVNIVESYFSDEHSISPPIRELLELKQDLTYFEAQSLLRELEKNEGKQARNVFGFFNSTPLKAVWQLLRAWEKENVHIYMGLQTLCQKVGYKDARQELNLNQLEKQTKTVESRLSEAEKVRSEWQQDITKFCKQWNLKLSELEICDADSIKTALVYRASVNLTDHLRKVKDCVVINKIVIEKAVHYIGKQAPSFSSSSNTGTTYTRPYSALDKLLQLFSSNNTTRTHDNDADVAVTQDLQVDASPLREELLQQPEFQVSLENDLIEIRAFMQQRIAEQIPVLPSSSSSSGVPAAGKILSRDDGKLLSGDDGSPVTVTVHDMRSGVSACDNLIQYLSDSDFVLSVRLLSRDDCVHRLVGNFLSLREKVASAKSSISELTALKTELDTSLRQMTAVVRREKERTLRLKAALGRALSKLLPSTETSVLLDDS